MRPFERKAREVKVRMKNLKLPVGIESFAEMQQEGFYCVDKTGLIRDLLNNWGKVNLFTRPRRFGKTLNMSMLKSFFEIGADRTLFDGLAISKETALCEEYMGNFPVIFISLKGDILVEPEDPDAGIVIEVKYAPTFRGLEQACAKAMEQIKARRYDERLREDGREDILAYGIAFNKKRCKAVCERLSGAVK